MWFRRKKQSVEGPYSLVLSNGRFATPEGVVHTNLQIRDNHIEKIGDDSHHHRSHSLDLDGMLVTPGLIDAEHPLDEDCFSPLKPGPYLDREKRQNELEVEFAEIIQQANKAGDIRFNAGFLDSLKNGVTTVASPRRPNVLPVPIRLPWSTWISSLIIEKNPAKKFVQARSEPVFVSLADGDSRAKSRELQLASEWGMLAPNLMAVGGVALTPNGSRHLAAAGAFLIWRPVTDEFIFGRSINADVLKQTGLQVLIGAGSRRDGGHGLLAALQRADRLGHLDRHQLLDAVTNLGASAFQMPAGRIREGHYADFAVWRADSVESAIFESGREALEMVILNGRVVLCRESSRHLVPNANRLLPVENEPGLYCVIDQAPCFT